jgi:lysozyme
MNYDRLKETLIKHEGLKLKPYKCTENKLTIGVGRNIEDNGITEAEARFLLENDVKECEYNLRSFSWFDKLSDVRQEVLVNLCFNVGYPSFLEFKRMIWFLSKGDFEKASAEMKDSKWFYQVETRAEQLVKAMLINSF